MTTTKIHGSRQIASDTITDTQINSAAAIATTKLADSLNFILRGGSVAFTADQSMGGFKLTNLAAPVSGGDAVRLTDLQAVQTGLDVKVSCRASTTTNGTLSTAYANGQVIDGVTLATGDRILIKDQTTGSENGIYTVNASGSPTRATDADSNTEVTGGMFSFVEEGTANADTGWILTNNGAIVLNTTALVFTKFTAISGGLNASGLVTRETPGGAVNGSNVTFTLANTPTLGTEEVYLNGILQEPGSGNDYTISGLTITYLAAPVAGDRIRVSYWK